MATSRDSNMPTQPEFVNCLSTAELRPPSLTCRELATLQEQRVKVKHEYVNTFTALPPPIIHGDVATSETQNLTTDSKFTFFDSAALHVQSSDFNIAEDLATSHGTVQPEFVNCSPTDLPCTLTDVATSQDQNVTFPEFVSCDSHEFPRPLIVCSCGLKENLNSVSPQCSHTQQFRVQNAGGAHIEGEIRVKQEPQEDVSHHIKQESCSVPDVSSCTGDTDLGPTVTHCSPPGTDLTNVLPTSPSNNLIGTPITDSIFYNLSMGKSIPTNHFFNKSMSSNNLPITNSPINSNLVPSKSNVLPLNRHMYYCTEPTNVSKVLSVRNVPNVLIPITDSLQSPPSARFTLPITDSLSDNYRVSRAISHTLPTQLPITDCNPVRNPSIFQKTPLPLGHSMTGNLPILNAGNSSNQQTPTQPITDVHTSRPLPSFQKTSTDFISHTLPQIRATAPINSLSPITDSSRFTRTHETSHPRTLPSTDPLNKAPCTTVSQTSQPDLSRTFTIAHHNVHQCESTPHVPTNHPNSGENIIRRSAPALHTPTNNTDTRNTAKNGVSVGKIAKPSSPTKLVSRMRNILLLFSDPEHVAVVAGRSSNSSAPKQYGSRKRFSPKSALDTTPPSKTTPISVSQISCPSTPVNPLTPSSTSNKNPSIVMEPECLSASCPSQTLPTVSNPSSNSSTAVSSNKYEILSESSMKSSDSTSTNPTFTVEPELILLEPCPSPHPIFSSGISHISITQSEFLTKSSLTQSFSTSSTSPPPPIVESPPTTESFANKTPRNSTASNVSPTLVMIPSPSINSLEAAPSGKTPISSKELVTSNFSIKNSELSLSTNIAKIRGTSSIKESQATTESPSSQSLYSDTSLNTATMDQWNLSTAPFPTKPPEPSNLSSSIALTEPGLPSESGLAQTQSLDSPTSIIKSSSTQPTTIDSPESSSDVFQSLWDREPPATRRPDKPICYGSANKVKHSNSKSTPNQTPNPPTPNQTPNPPTSTKKFFKSTVRSTKLVPPSRDTFFGVGEFGLLKKPSTTNPCHPTPVTSSTPAPITSSRHLTPVTRSIPAPITSSRHPTPATSSTPAPITSSRQPTPVTRSIPAPITSSRHPTPATSSTPAPITSSRHPTPATSSTPAPITSSRQPTPVTHYYYYYHSMPAPITSFTSPCHSKSSISAPIKKTQALTPPSSAQSLTPSSNTVPDAIQKSLAYSTPYPVKFQGPATGPPFAIRESGLSRKPLVVKFPNSSRYMLLVSKKKLVASKKTLPKKTSNPNLPVIPPHVAPPAKKKHPTPAFGYFSDGAFDNSQLCPYCGKIIKERKALLSHIRRVHITRPKMFCAHCTHSTSDKWHLTKHMRIHLDDKPHKCAHCGMRFISASRVNRHVNDIHTKAQKFGCTLCTYSTTQRGNLVAHMRSHSGERPYDCHICGRDFAHIGCVRQHIRDVHKVNLEKRKSRRGESVKRMRKKQGTSKKTARGGKQVQKKNVHIKSSTRKDTIKGGKNKKSQKDTDNLSGKVLKENKIKAPALKLKEQINNVPCKKLNTSKKVVQPLRELNQHITDVAKSKIVSNVARKKKQDKDVHPNVKKHVKMGDIKLSCVHCSYVTLHKGKLAKHMIQHIKNSAN